MDIAWFIALLILVVAAYAWGYDNGRASQMDADQEMELEKYRLDRFYEHERWLEERKDKHEIPPDA